MPLDGDQKVPVMPLHCLDHTVRADRGEPEPLAGVLDALMVAAAHAGYSGSAHDIVQHGPFQNIHGVENLFARLWQKGSQVQKKL